ncbi:MAG: coenzyme F420-0:L-glutamate ligase [Clostridia bacterium]|nr:coenzyme F420-0:L-glutamate ligase [Clostridia bacterium]
MGGFMNLVGTMSIGVKAPIIKKGDNLVKIVCDSVVKACKKHKLKLEDRDIIAVTEAIVAKSQGNFATLDDIATDVHEKFGNATVGLILPILSRNRFSLLLKGIAKGVKKLIIQLSLPADEVGNHLISDEQLLESGINPYDTLTEEEFYAKFGNTAHEFTGINYVELYKEFGGKNCEIIFSNNPCAILKYTKNVINADIHTRELTKKALKKGGARKIYSLSDILSESVNGSGFNPEYGLLGSNVSTNEVVKLFPKDTMKFAENLQAALKKKTGKNIECMVYGDGAFKDPVGKIWELADPVVSPGYTNGLIGLPNEIKLKYVADNQLGHLSGAEAQKAIMKIIQEKSKDLKNQNVSLGTTPRRLTDLLGSLADLTSGSGDKGTPIVLIKNYFKNYAD